MARQLPKRMRFKSGVYYFISFDGKWKALGSDISRALESYLTLYGDRCSASNRDMVTDLYLASIRG